MISELIGNLRRAHEEFSTGELASISLAGLNWAKIKCGNSGASHHEHGARAGREYVAGVDGQRYSIEIANDTGLRVEAVASVDGLDVIDGQRGSLAKRGYLVEPGSTLQIDGFRCSRDRVAYHLLRADPELRLLAERPSKHTRIGADERNPWWTSSSERHWV